MQENKKSKKKRFNPQLDRYWFLKLIYQRLLVLLLIILQIGVFVYLTIRVSEVSQMVSNTMRLITWLMVIFIILSRKVVDYKLSWIILVLAFPLVGGALFIFLNTSMFNRKINRNLNNSLSKIVPLRRYTNAIFQRLTEVKADQSALAKYIFNTTQYPVYVGNDAKYLPEGEIMFEEMLAAIRLAKRYVFLEFFIVDNGYLLDQLIELLAEKAEEGVKILFLYDDMGTMFRLPSRFPEDMRSLGIETRRFNHLFPVVSTQFNNRDHRKIVVVDGEVAFTGGINLADEYINVKTRFGHWKDGGVKFGGEASWAMSLMFLELWNATGPGEPMEEEEILAFCPKPEYLDFEAFPGEDIKTADSFIQPFGDTPFDDEFVGKMVYKKQIYNAKRYLYITTPYLVLDDEMVNSICQTAQSGVDVRIIMPHIFDKLYVRTVSRSFYRQFLEAGVRIFEYTPGFIHCKNLVSDDTSAVIGTINFDYRSLYLHFEDAVVLYNQDCIKDICNDFLETQAKSHEIFLNSFKFNIFQRAVSGILRLFSPLM